MTQRPRCEGATKKAAPKKAAKKAAKKVVKKAAPKKFVKKAPERLKTSAPGVNIGFQQKLPFPIGQIIEAVQVLRDLPK